MDTANDSEKNGISKFALLASAAATAAFVVSQTRLMQRLAQPPGSSALDDAKQRTPGPAVEPAVEPAAPVRAPHSEATAEAAATETALIKGTAPRRAPAAPPGGRMRFRTARPARERLHYGLPVRGQSRKAAKPGERDGTPAATPAAREEQAPALEQPDAVIELSAQTTASKLAGQALAWAQPRTVEHYEREPVATATAAPAFDDEEFDPEYIALCRAIACDGLSEEDGAEALEPQPVEAPAHEADPVDSMWWLPAPSLRYITAAALFVSAAYVAGSDAVTLIGSAATAFVQIEGGGDLLLRGWILCGAAALLPAGALLRGSLLLATRGRVRFRRLMPAPLGVGLRLAAVTALAAGAVLYAPAALSSALDTDYPVAAVASSSMEPALQKGQLVLLHGVDRPDELRIGDIVAFKHDGGLAMRRVAGFENDAIVLQADSAPDEMIAIRFEDVAGAAVSVAGTQVALPYLGNLSLLGERTAEPAALMDAPLSRGR